MSSRDSAIESQTVPQKVPQRVLESPRDSQRLPESPRDSHRESQKVTEGLREFQIEGAESPRESQTVPSWSEKVTIVWYGPEMVSWSKRAQKGKGKSSSAVLHTSIFDGLIVIMVYHISSAAAAATFSDFHSANWCNWCYKWNSKSLKQYHCNWCHKISFVRYPNWFNLTFEFCPK